MTQNEEQLEALRAELIAAREQTEQQLGDEQRRSEQQDQATRRDQQVGADMVALLAQIAQHRQEMEAHRQAVESQLAEERAACQRMFAELEQQRAALDAEREQLRRERERQVDDPERRSTAELRSDRSEDQATQFAAHPDEAAQQSEDQHDSESRHGDSETTDEDEEKIFDRLRSLPVFKTQSSEVTSEDESTVEAEATESTASRFDNSDTATSADVQDVSDTGQPASELGEEESEQATESSTTAGQAGHRAPASQAPTGEGDESIEAYMAALLNRVRGGSAEKPAHAQPKPEPALPAKAAEPTLEPTPSEVPEATETPTPPAVIEPVRRVRPPEISDLAAMRELANYQARAAIHIHGQQRSIKEAITLGGAVAAALLVTITVILIAPTGDTVIRTGAMVGLIASVYWGFRAAVASRQFLHAARGVLHVEQALRAKSSQRTSGPNDAAGQSPAASADHPLRVESAAGPPDADPAAKPTRTV